MMKAAASSLFCFMNKIKRVYIKGDRRIKT